MSIVQRRMWLATLLEEGVPMNILEQCLDENITFEELRSRAFAKMMAKSMTKEEVHQVEVATKKTQKGRRKTQR